MGRVSRLSLAVLSLLASWSSACGDSGRAGDDASAGATDPTPGSVTVTATTGQLPTGSATATEGSVTEGSGSESATGTTGTPTSPTDSISASASATTTADTSASATATTGDPVGPCSEDPPPGFIGPFDAACASEPQIGMFDPVVEWHKDTFVNNPGCNASASAPIVVQVNDDNMDGKVDSTDMPDILNVTAIA